MRAAHLSRRSRATRFIAFILVIIVILFFSISRRTTSVFSQSPVVRAQLSDALHVRPARIGEALPSSQNDVVASPLQAGGTGKRRLKGAPMDKQKVKQQQAAAFKSSALIALTPDSKDQRLQVQEWELNYLRKTMQRKERILAETHDEMLNAMGDLRSALREIGSPPPDEKSGTSAKRLPCHCLEQSAMAPEDVWCDNRRRRVSGAHVCVLSNVCFGGGERLVFLSPQRSKQERASVSVRIAGTEQTGSVVFHPPDGLERHEGVPSGRSAFEKIREAPLLRKTLVLYASKFPNHITHVLEGAGGLHFSIHRNAPRVSDCKPDDLTCFPEVGALHFLGTSSSGGWHENVLRIMMEDFSKNVSIAYQDHIAGKPFQCYEKAIVPGFYYSVFPDTEDTSSFQDAAVKYLESNAPRRAAGTGGESWKFSKNMRLGKILMSKRTSKRSVRDWDTLKKFIAAVAANYTTAQGRDITIEEIEYGGTSFEHQATTTADADILLGLHGADLTNMVFLRRGSVVLELNPLFFFENRFYELANNLGLHYMVWTCTTEECAFGGGAKDRFRAAVERFGYDFTTRTFRKAGQQLKWPYDRYLGYSCPQCDALGIPIMEYRDTDVFVGKSLDEIQEVVERAFRNLDWRRR